MSELDKLIHELYKKKSWLFNRNNERKIQILNEISFQGTPFTVSWIFQLVFSFKGQLSQKTAQTIHELMSKVKPSQWTQLYPSYQHITIEPYNLRYLSKFPPPVAVDLIGIASLNGNGRVRQKAIEKLQQIVSPKKIPYIMLRLADWVPQVQQAAQTALTECLSKQHAFDFISYVYILDWMTTVDRIDLSEYRSQIINFLAASSMDNLHQAINHPDKIIRSFGFKALLSKSPDKSDIIEKGAKDNNPKIRWQVFQNIRTLPAEIFTKYLPLFLTDDSPKIRSSAMNAIPADQFQNFQETVFKNTFCSSPSVRNTARFILTQHGFETFAPEYRKRIESGNISPGAISGLAETGTADDIATLARLISHHQPKIRSAAFAGQYRLNSAHAVPHLIEALFDPAKRVRLATASILCKHPGFDRISVRKVINTGNPPSRITALKVICSNPTWDALDVILTTITDPDKSVRTTAWKCFRSWFDKRKKKNWIKPSKPLLDIIETKLNDLDNQSFAIPEFAKKTWAKLPKLIDSGKRAWKY